MQKRKNKSQSVLKKYFKKYKFHFLMGFFALLVVDIFQLQIPVITGNITDGLQSGYYEFSNLLNQVLNLLLIGVIISGFRFVWRYFIFGTSRKIEYGLRNDFFGHLEKLSLRFFNEHKTGDLMAHATNDLNAIRMMVGPGVLMSLDAITLLVLVIYQMITKISLNLTLVAIIPLPLIAIGGFFFGKAIRSRFKNKQEAFAHMSEMVQENISGVQVVKAFVQESKEIKAFNKINKDNYNKNMRVIKLHAIMNPLATLVTGLSIAIVLGYGGYMTMLGNISLGDFVAFTQYLLMLVWPMIAFGWCINIMSQGLASLSRFQKILDEKPEILDEGTVKEIESIKGDIAIKNLTFNYPGSDIKDLDNISITVNKGETLGIVGRTGSGKTTLVNMLLRMYNPPRGTIFIDNQDIMNIPLKVLRHSIGYVPQDNFLFSDTISRNIAFGVIETSDEYIECAARNANVHDNIIEFSHKYETIVGERGVTLSGGQKQRISIARALIKDPAIMILDDSVSAVDTNTEEQILRHIKDERKDKTTIIIAHRISTIQNSDKIIVIDEGKIIESGNHESLLEQKGLYYNMVQKQQLEKELDKE
ncbi:multidrug ABC transporter ATP-binding protein [Vallitalea longa]|uniref:Multidrug ABC transporter ATP-binding protein n=1 Tax=Vallitalea longa TaxID=2936439 RepID=A0A9W6DGE2_9FIRM|nr:ABC transporter ATP-binding protein [Vallitalea longa]GKX30378.1 multidrug ABC transporter ATP-binding protein [Vallitalea longa]